MVHRDLLDSGLLLMSGTGNAMGKILKFLNSGLGLLLVGVVAGAIGLFTWQRVDWLFMQEYLRAQVMLDRKVDLVERINEGVGILVAHADGVIAVIVKPKVPSSQRDEVIELYNYEQAKWLGMILSHHLLKT
ncbi:MAG: hypothetical protein AB4038_03505 [Prochloraceae cyanobacterium]